MCDTFYIPEEKNIYNANILCKNSDREPNEAQAIVNYKRNSIDKAKNKFIKTTYKEVPADSSNEIIISKPFQMWGAEMGVNEYGVAMGNEAVFTKIPFKKDNSGLTGMDIIRLALERTKSAKDALHYSIKLIEEYGQDACGGYENKNFYYHNSFLIIDKKEAYCLETADRFWAYKKLKDFYNISNGLTLTDDYDDIHKDAIEYAIKKNWYKKGEHFNFAKVFSDKLYTYFSQCEVRRSITKKITLKEKIDLIDCIETLQSHGENRENHLDSMNSICLHSGGILTPSETTGSMIAILRENIITVWLTGTSHPCLSLYKPFFFNTNVLAKIPEPSFEYDNSLWWKAEKIHRQLLETHQDLKKEYQKELKIIQKEFIELEKVLLNENKIHKKYLEELSNYCLDKEKKFLEQWESELKKHKKGRYFLFLKRPIYTTYRTILNKKAKLKIS